MDQLDLVDTDEVVDVQIAQIREAERLRAEYPVDQWLALKAFLYSVDEYRQSDEAFTRAKLPSLEDLIEIFLRDFSKAARPSWDAALRPLLTGNLVKQRFGGTVRQLVAKVWSREAQGLFDRLQSEIPPATDPPGFAESKLGASRPIPTLTDPMTDDGPKLDLSRLEE